MSKDLFEAALAAEGVSGIQADIARSIYHQESSGGKNTKTSNAGAMGGMQIIPTTFKSVADKGWDINDPMHNARAGIRYVGQLFKQAGGDPKLTAAGYYGGPGGLEKARKGLAVSDPRNPNAPNTLQYGEQVAARIGDKAVVRPEPVPTVQVAQAPIEQPVQVPVVPASVQNPADVTWDQLQQNMPNKPVQVADLNYGTSGSVPVQGIRPVAMSMPNPNFQVFKSWIGRA